MLCYQEGLLLPPSGLRYFVKSSCVEKQRRKNQDGKLSVDMWAWLYFLKVVFINHKNPTAR